MTPETLTVGASEMTTNPAAIWARLLESFETALTPDAARAILAVKFSHAEVDRINLLIAKARDGALTPPEERELDSYLLISTLTGVMWAKARMALKLAGLDPEAA